MAKRKKRKSTRSRSKQNDTPGWLWGVFGLAIGLSVAAAVWVNDRRVAAPVERAAVEAPASLNYDDNGEVAAVPEPAMDPEEAGEVAESNGEKRFTFYEMLKRSEVLVPDDEPETGEAAPVAVVDPGTYVLQVGSFSSFADADRRRAELALHGLESQIQKASVRDAIRYRVRIGPTDNLDELNLLRSRLRAARIDALVMREVE